MASTLDIEIPSQLIAYLRKQGHLTAMAPDPHIRTLAGGVSNRTVWVAFADGRAWVLKQALAKLRVKVDWFSDPVRIQREAMGLRWLGKLIPDGGITPLIFEDKEHHLLAMEAVQTPHKNWKDLLLQGQIVSDHIDQFATLLATLQRQAMAHHSSIASDFADRRFFESLRLEPYYSYTAEQVPGAASFLQELIDKTRSRCLTLVHGDYSPKNILVHQGQLILLDHEVIHFGDPAFDVGFSLAHLLSKAHFLAAHRKTLLNASRQYWQRYRQVLGDVAWSDDLEPMCVQHTLGCLLARVRGRSPLEYLDASHRQGQEAMVLGLIDKCQGELGLLGLIDLVEERLG